MLKHWWTLPEEKRRSIGILIRNRHWKNLYTRYGDLLQITSKEEAKKVGRWLEANNFNPTNSDTTYEHSQNYWYDREREVYVLHLPSLKKPFVLRETMWSAIKEAYSNWDGEAASVNEVCRKFGLSRTTVQEILRVMGVTHDSAVWTNSHVNKTSEDDLVQDLLQRKLQSVLVKSEKLEWSRVKKDANKWRRASLAAEEIDQKFSNSKKRYKVKKLSLKESSNSFIALISPTDYHWGMYGPDYTGEKYNRDIAKKRLFESTQGLLSRIAIRGAPEKIILALGGDSLHFDNYQRKTTMGTIQDSDGTPEEIAWSWIELCREYVDYVRQIAPVELFVIPGNHDRLSAVFLRAAMKGWFHGAKDVSVVECLGPRQYCQYGDSMLTLMHGDIGSVKDWPAIIAGEEPQLWGSSSNRFIFTGHLHTERELPTFGNVTVYRMPSLAGTDNWHYGKGYKSRKALVAYIIDKEKGVIATEIEPVS